VSVSIKYVCDVCVSYPCLSLSLSLSISLSASLFLSLSVCVCVFVCVCVCVWNQTALTIAFGTYVFVCVSIFVCVCVYMRMYICKCVRVCVCENQTVLTIALGGATMGWLRLVCSLILQVSFPEYSLFYRALWHNRPIHLRSLLIKAIPYSTCVLLIGWSQV